MNPNNIYYLVAMAVIMNPSNIYYVVAMVVIMNPSNIYCLVAMAVLCLALAIRRWIGVLANAID